jgi:hypothetical protein
MDGQKDGGDILSQYLYIKNSYVTEVAWTMYRHQVPSLLYI